MKERFFLVFPENRLWLVAGFFVVAATILLFVFDVAERHADTFSLPRYCDDPARHVTLVREILVEKDPAGTENRRPYVIAAKLIYLVPRLTDEPLDAYIARLERQIRETCE